MSVGGVGRARAIETIGTDTTAAAAPAGVPAGTLPERSTSISARHEVQRLLLEKSAAAAPPAAVEGNERLRAAFDEIAAPVGPARTYRLDRNVDAFASKWETLEGAKKSIDTTYFFYDDDIFGYAYLGHLFKKAREGLDVRIMIDDTGSRGGKGLKSTGRDEDLLQELVNVDPERVEVGVFNPLFSKDPTSVESLVSSNHDKLLIADGAVVETGGRNIGADYFSDPKDRKGVFRDTDIHIASPVAAKKATKAFDLEFQDDDTKKIKPDMFGNWKKHDIELLGAYAMMEYWMKAPPLSDADKLAIRNGAPAAKKFEDEVIAHVLAELPKLGIDREPSRSDMEVLRKLAKELVSNCEVRGSHGVEHKTFDGEVKVIDRVAATTEVGANEISDALISLIDSAEKEIKIHNPYVVMTDRAIDALAAAGKRGVKIDIITNSPESTDSTVTQAFFLEDWPTILARIPNARILVATGEQKHHSKSFVIDGVLTGVSTYNADWISARVNSEIVALQWGKEFAEDTLASYRADLANPEHGFVEYKIKRDEQGRALVKDGAPIVEYGPEDHCPAEMLDAYKRRRAVWNFARDHLDALLPLRRQKLDPARDPIKVIE